MWKIFLILCVCLLLPICTEAREGDPVLSDIQVDGSILLDELGGDGDPPTRGFYVGPSTDTDEGGMSYLEGELKIRTNGSDRVIVDSSGNVGIGTSPAYRLSVASSENAVGINVAQTYASGLAYGIVADINTSNAGHNFAFYASSSNSGDGSAFSFYGHSGVLYNGGYVGIGNPYPAYALDVSGAGRFTGALTASSFSGNGAGLTDLNANNIDTGTISDDRLSDSVTAWTLSGDDLSTDNVIVGRSLVAFASKTDGATLQSVDPVYNITTGGNNFESMMGTMDVYTEDRTPMLQLVKYMGGTLNPDPDVWDGGVAQFVGYMSDASKEFMSVTTTTLINHADQGTSGTWVGEDGRWQEGVATHSRVYAGPGTNSFVTWNISVDTTAGSPPNQVIGVEYDMKSLTDNTKMTVLGGDYYPNRGNYVGIWIVSGDTAAPEGYQTDWAIGIGSGVAKTGGLNPSAHPDKSGWYSGLVVTANTLVPGAGNEAIWLQGASSTTYDAVGIRLTGYHTSGIVMDTATFTDGAGIQMGASNYIWFGDEKLWRNGNDLYWGLTKLN